MDYQKVRKQFIPMSETMFYILLSLREERHGYGIMLFVRELTGQRLVLGAGTIYQSLGKLERGGLIAATKETSRKKQYVITDMGYIILTEEAMRIREMCRDMEGLL